VSQIAGFDEAPASQLRPRLLALTESPWWADELLLGRPYGDLARLLDASDRIIRALPTAQVDAALAGHPRIGERASGLDGESAARSAREQAGMSDADPQTAAAMAQGNADYEARFGRIYLVAAAGRGAADLLAFLRERLRHHPDAELDVVRGELARITRLRLTDSLGAGERDASEQDASEQEQSS
jgi:2-oxo-4-hydroxy-4-carboxy-5-ureidoimidazoline decarboxylase